MTPAELEILADPATLAFAGSRVELSTKVFMPAASSTRLGKTEVMDSNVCHCGANIVPRASAAHEL